jgi:hypothetical protein
MKTFRIGVYEEQSGYVTIKAANRKRAKELVFNKLSANGVEAFKTFDVQHRNVELI